MRIKYIISILFLFFCITSCVDEYWPEVDKYESLLVVDGLLTNSSDQVVVKLSISSSIDDNIFIPLSNASLYITDDNNIVSFLTETETGVYKPLDSSFHGQIEKQYKLHIDLPNGKSYESNVCQLPTPSPIDTVYGILENSNLPDSNHDFPGIQFFVENHSVINDTCYYLWKMYQTYEYRSTFDIDYTWEGELIPNPDPTTLRTCWHTSKVNDFVVSSTKYINPNSVKKFPLHFVSTLTKALSIRYSLLVRQLTISQSAFDFYDAIGKQNSAVGNMWSEQPVQILGNIHNIDNSQEPVLGYFIVAGTDEMRIFMNKPQLIFHYTECAPDFEAMRFISFEPPSMWPIYIDDIMFLGLARADHKFCFDCRESGGSLIPPDFWE